MTQRYASTESQRNANGENRLRDSLFMKIGKTAVSALSLFPTAAVASMVAADYFGAADTSVVWSYAQVKDHLRGESPPVKDVLANAAAATLAFGESAAMGLAVARNKKLRSGYKAMARSYEETREKRGKIRQGALKVATLPLQLMGKVGGAAESVGNKIAARKNKIARDIGRVAIDFGQALAMSSTGVVGYETLQDNAPDTKRVLWLGALGTGAVLGLIGVGVGLDATPGLHTAFHYIAEGFDMVTQPNLAHPSTTPTADTVLGVAATGLGYTGARIANYQRNHPELSEDGLSAPPAISDQQEPETI